MKDLRGCLLLIVCFVQCTLYAQSYEQVFQQAVFILHDSSRQSASINAKLLLTRNSLEFAESHQTPWKLRDVSAVVIGTTRYFVKPVTNLIDTIKLMELVIAGKISFYISPRITTNDEFFIEKGNNVYQLRIVRKYIAERGHTHLIKEYASYLQRVMLDCNVIDQHRIASDLAFTYGAIFEQISAYNTACGWQTIQFDQKDLKPKLTVGFVAGGTTLRNKLSYYYLEMYTGKTSLTGIFAGPSFALDFQKFYDTRIIYDFMVERLAGNAFANEYYRRDRHVFDYEIFSFKQAVSANVSIQRIGERNIQLGFGLLAQHQLKNNTKVRTGPNTPTDPNFFKTRFDKFNMSPFVHVHISKGKFGLRYQIIAMSMQMKKIEIFGFERRLSLHYDLTR